MKKRLIAVVMTALLPAVAMLGYNEFLARQQRSLEVHRVASQTARQAASEIERILEGVRNLLIAASAIPTVADRGGSGCVDGLNRIVESLGSIHTIMVLDHAGKLICDSAGTPPGLDFADRPYFSGALSRGDFVVGEYTVSRPTGAKILPVAMPMGKVADSDGVIVTGIRLDWLERRIEERGLLPGGTVTVADSGGTILARNPDPEEFVGTRIADEYLHLVTAPRSGTVELTGRDGVERIVGYEPLISGSMPIYVSAGIAKQQAFAAIDQATAAGAAIIVVGALVAIFAALFLGNRFIIAPIGRIMEVLDRWRTGDETARTGLRGHHGEIGQVGAAIDQMLEELDQRRRMAESAETARSLLVRELSHRVKNTFSVVQAIARQTFGRRNAAEYESFSERLGALAGAYDILVSGQWQSGDIRDVVTRALRPHHNEQDGRIVYRGGFCRLPAQAVLSLSMVVHELATNATKYGALSFEQGRIDISWRQEEDRVSFVWTESNGVNVKPPEKQGFGSRLIRSAFPAEFEPETLSRFEEGGLVFTLHFRLTESHAAS